MRERERIGLTTVVRTFQDHDRIISHDCPDHLRKYYIGGKVSPKNLVVPWRRGL
jgi:hypothetical protein